MSIRIIDQSPDQSAQNPPPDGDIGLVEKTEVRVVIAVSTPDGHTCVLKGDSSGNALEAISFATDDTPRFSSESNTDTPADMQNFVDVPVDGWQFKPQAGTFKVGTGLERTVCRLAGRWALTALAAAVREARQQGRSMPGPGATRVQNGR